MTAYYNEIDPYAAQWLRNLIAGGHIAPGYVDERSVEDVYPSDLRGFTQCHFFAGIGVWSHALRRAGWGDDRPVWSGSCPCQPFSQAGEGAGFDDERHLWPALFHLIRECKPAVVVGEQVASRDADPWIDLVQDDVEGVGYRFGAVPFPSAGIGAPHIRDRLYWVAHAASVKHPKHRPGQVPGAKEPISHRLHSRHRIAGSGEACGLANAGHNHDAGEVQATSAWQSQAIGPADQPGGRCAPSGGMGQPDCGGFVGQGLSAQRSLRVDQPLPSWAGKTGEHNAIAACGGKGVGTSGADGPSPTNGFWRDVDWLLCRDGKWRPVEPGSFPLVDGPAARVGQRGADWHTPAGPQGFGHRAGRLKGYGNAINAQAARAFIESVMGVS